MAKKNEKQTEPIVKLRLVLDVDYIPNGVSKTYLENILESIADKAAGDGLMTCDTNAMVDTWHARIEERE